MTIPGPYGRQTVGQGFAEVPCTLCTAYCGHGTGMHSLYTVHSTLCTNYCVHHGLVYHVTNIHMKWAPVVHCLHCSTLVDYDKTCHFSRRNGDRSGQERERVERSDLAHHHTTPRGITPKVVTKTNGSLEGEYIGRSQTKTEMTHL